MINCVFEQDQVNETMTIITLPHNLPYPFYCQQLGMGMKPHFRAKGITDFTPQVSPWSFHLNADI